MQNEIVKHSGNITTLMRESLLKQKGCVLWFTGLSGSGKSTIAYALEEALFKKNIISYVLDGDNIRHGLNKNLGFTAEDRQENIRRVAEVASLFASACMITIVSFISPFAQDRNMAKEIITDEKFIEVYINTPLETCEKRDPKGIYKKVRSGLIPEFTGISSPYEKPVSPDLIIDTEKTSVLKSVERIINYLEARKII